jgi:[ribosomal protein S5]-alanine N-acetyltransferase
MNQITLRPWRIEDLPNLVQYANNYKVAKNLTNRFPHPYGEEDGKAFINMATSIAPISIMAITINDEAIGGIGVHLQSDVWGRNAELGYWLAEPHWNKGIISAAIQQMIAFAFTTFDIDRLFARPFGSNLASQKVLEKNGFVLEARLEKTIFKNGVYEDELIYAVRKK